MRQFMSSQAECWVRNATLNAIWSVTDLSIGLTTLSSILRHLKSNRFTEWIIDVLSVPGHTAEMNIFGTRFILTEEPENLKAIFTNQVYFELFRVFFTERSCLPFALSFETMAKEFQATRPWDIWPLTLYLPVYIL